MHTFHVLGENSEMHYVVILGQIVMNIVVVNFDPKPNANKTTMQTNIKGQNRKHSKSSHLFKGSRFATQE